MDKLAKRDPNSALGGVRSEEERMKAVLQTFWGRFSKRTVESYRECLCVFAHWACSTGLTPANAGTDLTKMASWLIRLDAFSAHEHVQAFITDQTAKDFAPNTVNLRVSALRSFVKMCVTAGLISWTLNVRLPKAQNVRDTRGPDAEVVRKLLKFTRTNNPKAHAMLTLLFGHGFRSVEVRELTLGDVKLEGEGLVLFVRGKGQTGKKPIPLDEGAVPSMKKWLEVRARTALARGRTPTDFVFFAGSDPTKPLSDSALGSFITRVGAKAGVKLWPHALRHSAITAALDATDGNVRDVAKFSRHAKIETVMRYDDARRNTAGEVAAKLRGFNDE